MAQTIDIESGRAMLHRSMKEVPQAFFDYYQSSVSQHLD
jgi:hypothetical protein